MFKTIFSKLVIIFILILLIGFSITGAMLYYFLTNFVSSEKEGLLIQSAEKIAEVLSVYVENQDNQAAKQTFSYILQSYSVNTNSIIWIVNTNGDLVFTEPEVSEKLKQKFKDDAGHFKLPDERQYKKVLGGQTHVKERGSFYGLFDGTGVAWLTIEEPVIYNKKVIAAVYFNTPMPEIHRVRTSVFRFFMLSVSASILISILLIYIFSLRISRPLKEINNAAKIIAGGEFRNRLHINTQDEIGELAESFNQMVTDLQNLEEMRRGFIANVSHELRTPMTSIRGFIEGIIDGTIPYEKQKDYLSIVRDETIRLNRLVNDLLDLAKMEAGEMKLTFKNFNINELIRRCIIKLENLIISKNIQIEAAFETDEIFVEADADAIERVIINLIHNAIKFTNDFGTIIITTSNKKDKVYIEIQDDGVGIDVEEINNVWERFYKSDKSRGRDKGGTGLGLAIVKNIINEHKQQIWLESELNIGTKFTFTLKSSEEIEI